MDSNPKKNNPTNTQTVTTPTCGSLWLSECEIRVSLDSQRWIMVVLCLVEIIVDCSWDGA